MPAAMLPPTRAPMRAVLPTVLALCFPIVSHAASAAGVPLVGLLWLCALLLAGSVLGKRSPVMLALGLLCLGAALLGHFSGHAERLLRLPPVIIFLALAWFFGQSLRPGETPLISSIGERVRGTLPPPVARYGRRLTGIWAFFFVAMAVESALLGLYASPFWWSLFTNFINFALVALLFVGEYPVRRILLGDLEPTPFLVGLREAARAPSRQ